MERFLNEDTVEGQITNPLTQNLYTYAVNNPLRYADPSGNMHTEIGVRYTNEDRAALAAYQQLFDKGQSQNDAYLMQAAHDSANLIRLKYESTVNRITYVDYYTGTPSKKRGSQEYTSSMYSELLNGNASPVPLADVLMNTVGVIGGPGDMKIAYTITSDAVQAVMEQWGKTTERRQ